MERTFRHSVTYTNQGRVPVSDVATSLLANEKLMREALAVLQDLYPGLEITDISVVFRRASSDSPLQEAMEAVASVVFQNDIEKRIPAAIQDLTGMHVPENLESVVSIVVIAITTYGVYWLLSRAGKRESQGALAVNGNYNQILNVGGSLLLVPGGQIGEAIQKRFDRGRGPSLARRALEMIRPAQREAGEAAILGGGVEITPQTVAAAPATPGDDPLEDNETHDPYTAQKVVIHATDLDSNRTGWAGHIPGICEKRLPMRLYPSIRPQQLFGRQEITGDIIVISRRNLEGDFIPYLFHLVAVH